MNKVNGFFFGTSNSKAQSVKSHLSVTNKTSRKSLRGSVKYQPNEVLDNLAFESTYKRASPAHFGLDTTFNGGENDDPEDDEDRDNFDFSDQDEVDLKPGVKILRSAKKRISNARSENYGS